MKTTLNKKQIQHISNLIRARGVNYCDVNKEFTDHIACEIEELLSKEKLSYMQAAKKVFLRYNRFYFMKIEEQKEKYVRKQSWKELKHEFIQFFTIPKIIITITLYFGILYALEMSVLEYIKYTTFSLLTVVLLIFIILKYKWIGKGRYIQLQKYHWSLSFLFNILLQFILHSNELLINVNIYLNAIIYTFILLVFYIFTYLYAIQIIKMKKVYA